ncbi:aspartate aminotransferase [Paratrimastix pyriformis]|uniref:Aspartate aminotransferase n=1 Tax=Paratrimastix pyriformis TaxID=342808 RepID=A0ABQ8U9X9_9EUKA|nr:aspartate aminotransferase [Paratrimastix pyriformis]
MEASKIISGTCLKNLAGSSMIRKMFEEGIELRKVHGNEVLDFTLGNPTLEPPHQFTEALAEIAAHPPANLHYYMPNSGHVSCRAAIAAALTQWHGVNLTADQLCMTVGAAGALVTLFKTLCEPGDEVITLAPCFAEYASYMSHFGCVQKVCYPTATLDPDMGCLERIITDRTRCIVLNSPNNPTGHIYPVEVLKAMADLLTKKNQGRERPILILCDEPYRRLVYQGFTCPSIMPLYPYTIIASSFSKDLSLPGERIGFIAVHPHIYSPTVMAGIATSLRQLGYVNAPSLMQFAVERAVQSSIDMSWYQERRDLIYQAVVAAGLDCVEPSGAFYVFFKVPKGCTDAEMVAILKRRLVLSVPGTGFKAPGFVRMAFCVPLDDIRRLAPRLKEAADEARAMVAARTPRFLLAPQDSA